MIEDKRWTVVRKDSWLHQLRRAAELVNKVCSRSDEGW